MLRGNYPAKVDDKGRVKVPGAYLAELRDLGEQFYITSENGDYAQMYPMKAWLAIEEKLARMSSHNPTKKRYLARTNYYGQVVEMDAQGRVLIPAVLRDSAQISGQVDMLGQLTFLEIWNHDRYMDNMNRNPITEEDLNVLDQADI
jgi:MraZ protein